ncbi:site-specific integrase [Aliihoeflea sp. 40Bstr573]|uniref:tyrosine-type recombinase/integrase n=1 Tax=Aliihoeflea sp. 40Bstr573 TaxID=2696467 RepID=UPI002111D5C8|nr:site-specific integrase [Aliihoeflea sp. 40Bstr573]MCO6388502.1 integrase arm-type DNA-binding domain-containing protein [Aliihoeflea sp. 40Bstr573]
MPVRATEFTALEVKRAMRPGLHAVGGVPGLCLQIAPSGAKSWILRVLVNGRRREIGVGGYPDVMLAEARERARSIRTQIRDGVDPVADRRARRAAQRAKVNAVTFEQAAREWHQSKQSEYRNPKHAAQVLSTIETYAVPVIGTIPVVQIGLKEVLAVLQPIWTDKTETASRLRGRIESVLAWATVSGHRSGDNPARWKGNLDAVLAQPGKIARVKHHAALPIEQLPAFFARLRQQSGMAARALEFLVLTAARSGEVRGAKWMELDSDAGVWTVPAERMKAGREHRVPLSSQARHLLELLPEFEGSDFVFSAPRGGMLSDMSISAVMRRMDAGAVPHGFRSTFRDWAAEHTEYAGEIAEMALAHTISNKVEAAYRRGDLLAKRRQMMNDWAEYCLSLNR